MVYGGKDFPKSQVLSSECKIERVSVKMYEDVCKDGEDYELPCMT